MRRSMPGRFRRATSCLVTGLLVTVACAPDTDVAADGSAPAAGSPRAEPATEWVELFNGEDLTGWTPKIRGLALGEDPLATFRVEDGAIVVGYENYESFDERFGHLFYDEPFGDYELLVEYRFVGEQIEDGPGWAFRNSGVMFHSQPAESMTLDQDFPISLEAQFLGGNGEDDRPTANLCTPGTHVEMDGELVTQHCITADAPTIHGDDWVTVVIRAQGGSIEHVIDDTVVLSYENPVVGGGEANDHDPAAWTDGAELRGGYLALQSESHPVQFRRVALRRR